MRLSTDQLIALGAAVGAVLILVVKVVADLVDYFCRDDKWPFGDGDDEIQS